MSYVIFRGYCARWAALGAKVTWGEGHGGDTGSHLLSLNFTKAVLVVALECGQVVIVRRELAVNLYGLSPGSKK